jgi:hypothetical protein
VELEGKRRTRRSGRGKVAEDVQKESSRQEWKGDEEWNEEEQ